LSKVLKAIASLRKRRITNGKARKSSRVVTGASKGIGAGIAKALAAKARPWSSTNASSKEGADRCSRKSPRKAAKVAMRRARRRLQEADITRLFAETKKAYGNASISSWNKRRHL